MNRIILKGLLPLILITNLYASALSEPTTYSKDLYNQSILDGNYDVTISKPDKFLDFNYGDRVASPSQISNAILTWAKESNKLKVVEYARSHENRPLYALYISSESNIDNLDRIKTDIGMLADARSTSESQAKSLIKSLPAIAWMAYSIHGNETSGSDAALGLIYHLIASKDEDVIKMLSDMVIIVDPMMNPDGRDRFAKSLEQYRGTAPNYDDQSLLHTGDWPYGRTNHYFFDLNRDWIYLTQPETQGRVKLINEWSPQILVDAHEMGPQDTFMTGPPREPINKNIDKDLVGISKRKYFSPANYGDVKITLPILNKYCRGNCLDAGCGDMPYKDYILELVHNYDTIDYEAHIDGIKYIGDIQDMHMIEDSTYDSIVCFEVLEHVQNPFKAVSEVKRVIKKDGIFILSVPHLSRLHDMPHLSLIHISEPTRPY